MPGPTGGPALRRTAPSSIRPHRPTRRRARASNCERWCFTGARLLHLPPFGGGGGGGGGREGGPSPRTRTRGEPPSPGSHLRCDPPSPRKRGEVSQTFWHQLKV